MEGKEIKEKKEPAARREASEGIKTKDDAKGVETRGKSKGGRVELVGGNRYKRKTKDGDSAKQRASSD